MIPADAGFDHAHGTSRSPLRCSAACPIDARRSRQAPRARPAGNETGVIRDLGDGSLKRGAVGTIAGKAKVSLGAEEIFFLRSSNCAIERRDSSRGELTFTDSIGDRNKMSELPENIELAANFLFARVDAAIAPEAVPEKSDGLHPRRRAKSPRSLI